MAEARTIVVSVRLDPESVHALDLLVGSGIARSRSEATARLVHIGLSASAKLLEAAREIAGRARRLRQEFGSGTAFPPLRPPRTERDAEIDTEPDAETDAGDGDGTSGAVTHGAKDDEALLRLYQEAVERSRAEKKAGGDLDVFRAATRPEPGAIQAMIEKSPQLVHQHDERGWTPLHLAALSGAYRTVNVLVGAGADPSVRSANALAATPLHAAAFSRSWYAADALLLYGADVNARQANGWTPLHLAAYNGDHVMVEKLLESGADPSISSLKGETPLDIALRAGHRSVARLLARARSGPPRLSL